MLRICYIYVPCTYILPTRNYNNMSARHLRHSDVHSVFITYSDIRTLCTYIHSQSAPFIYYLRACAQIYRRGT